MENIKSAHEFFLERLDLTSTQTPTTSIVEIMIEFSKAHVKKALYEASCSAQVDCDCDAYIEGNVFVSEESIVNAYPLTNII